MARWIEKSLAQHQTMVVKLYRVQVSSRTGLPGLNQEKSGLELSAIYWSVELIVCPFPQSKTLVCLLDGQDNKVDGRH